MARSSPPRHRSRSSSSERESRCSGGACRQGHIGVNPDANVGGLWSTVPMHRQIAGSLTGRVTKWIVLVAWLVIAAGLHGLLPEARPTSRTTRPRRGCPRRAESTRALEKLGPFQDQNAIPTLVVYEREGGLTEADLAAIEEQRQGVRRARRARCPRRGPAARRRQPEDRRAVRRQRRLRGRRGRPDPGHLRLRQGRLERPARRRRRAPRHRQDRRRRDLHRRHRAARPPTPPRPSAASTPPCSSPPSASSS